MRSNIVVVTLTIIVISLVLSACHRGRHRNTAHKESRAIEHLAKKLDLSSEQKVEVARVQSEFVALKEEGRVIKEEWYGYALSQFNEDAENSEAETTFSRNQANRMEKLGQRFADSVTELKNILTNEQEQILVAELQKNNNHIRHD